MGHSQGSRSVLFPTSPLLGTSPVTLLPSGMGLRILGGPEGQVSHHTGTSCRPLCQDASVAFYLLELKGPERFEQRVPLCGPCMVLAALQACVAPSPQLAGAGTHASSPRPTYSVALKPISTTEAAPMCKHLPCAVLVRDYKRRHSPGELKRVTRVLVQTRSNRLCLGKWFKIATHTCPAASSHLSSDSGQRLKI